ncbi:MAG: GGDEF domain-containing protein [Methylococcales bacterium]|nr:GGDEF domain-containing protein [Methylococcales bacterium]MCK5477769.1 GGDEF domain-containing protein [Methylococcales bacterium]
MVRNDFGVKLTQNLLLSGCNEDKAQQIGQRIIEKFKKVPLLFQGININLSASIGIATYPSHGKTLEEVLHNADGAMYTSKEQGNNLITLY